MAGNRFSLKVAAARRGYPSYDALAEPVLARWKQLDKRRQKWPGLRSLGGKLGAIDSGKPVWLRNHPKAAQALADVLGIGVEQLPLDRPAVPPQRHGFEDIRDLRPLDLSSEEPCRLLESPWWSPELLKGRVWINAPRGTGKSLAAAVHRARGQHVVEVSRLMDAMDALPVDGAVVIRVGGPDSETDEEAVDELVSDRNILVLANFPVPVGPRRLAHARAVLEERQGKRVPLDEVRRLVSDMDWRTLTWEPRPAWRETLLRWVFDRLGAPEKRREAVQKWLIDHDPEGRLFATPGDVLSLVGRAVEQTALSRVGPEELIAWWWQRRGRTARTEGHTRSSWLTALGEKAAHALADAAFDDPSASFPVRAEAAWWSQRIPGAVAPADPVAALAAWVEEIAREPQQTKRKGLANAWKKESVRVSADEAVAHLRVARILEPAGDRRLELGPPWVVEWWAEARTRELLRSDDVRTWGRLAAEPTRRRIVEKVLDGLNQRQLLELVEGVTAVARLPADLGWVAAVEAIFGAVGRRLLVPGARAADWPVPHLHALYRLQRGWLLSRYNDHIPQPLTRASGERDGDAAWVAECWAWSLRLPPPPETLDEAHAWLFPGWHPISLEQMPHWMRSLHRGAPSFGFASEMADQVLARVADAALPELLPEPMLVPAVLSAGERGWQLAPEHAESLIHDEALADQLVDRLRSADPERRRAIATAFWRALSRAQHWSVPRLQREQPRVIALLADTLDIAEISVAADEGRIPFWSLKERDRWPPRWWNAAARALIPGNRQGLHDLVPAPMDADAADIVETLADIDTREHRWVETLWRVAPERALARASSSYPASPDASRWFFGAPSVAHASLLALVGSADASIPTWARRWLVQILPQAGAAADGVFRLLVPRPVD